MPLCLSTHLGFLDGGMVATEIKKFPPKIPILMVIDHLEVPDGALKSADVVVAKFDGDYFLLSAIRSVLADKPVLQGKTKRACRTGNSPAIDTLATGARSQPAVPNANVPFSPEEWQSILNGTVKFGSDA